MSTRVYYVYYLSSAYSMSKRYVYVRIETSSTYIYILPHAAEFSVSIYSVFPRLPHHCRVRPSAVVLTKCFGDVVSGSGEG